MITLDNHDQLRQQLKQIPRTSSLPLHLGGKAGRSSCHDLIVGMLATQRPIFLSCCHIVPHREEEFYLYTLHDPTVSSKGVATSTMPFFTLCPLVDRHTRSDWQSFFLLLHLMPARFKIFMSTLFYIGHGCGERLVAHLTDSYKDKVRGIDHHHHHLHHRLQDGRQRQEAGQDRGCAEEGRGSGGGPEDICICIYICSGA